MHFLSHFLEVSLILFMYIDISRRVCMTKITGSGLDDWIYWHLITVNTGLLLIYTIYSSPLHTH
jgi:hypothetical protein